MDISSELHWRSRESLEPLLIARTPVLNFEGERRGPTSKLPGVTNEDSVLEEATHNLREAAQRIRATQSVMNPQGMTQDENYRELVIRLSTALAMTEAKRRRG